MTDEDPLAKFFGDEDPSVVGSWDSNFATYAEAREKRAYIDSLDVDHGPDCVGVKPQYSTLGLRPDGDRVGVLECPLCHASRTLVNEQPVDAGPPATRRGRPRGPSVSKKHIEAEFWRLTAELGRAPTQEQLAKALDDMPPRTLQDNLKAYKLPWPIE
jgi:hypothetical protein